MALHSNLYLSDTDENFNAFSAHIHNDYSFIGCLCRLYPERIMSNPAREESGNVRILDTIDKNRWNIIYISQCLLCNTVFRVEEGESHYIWWKWDIVKNQSTPTESTTNEPIDDR